MAKFADARALALADFRIPLLFLAVALILRSPAFLSAQLQPDEGLYILQAAEWLRGGWPYVAVWDMHPAGAPALLLLVHALVPDPVIALRITGILVIAATATGLFSIARLFGGSVCTAIAAGMLYIAYSVVAGGLATNTEIMFAPFVVLAARLLFNEAMGQQAPRVGMVFAAGLSAGVALWVKQVTALETSALWLTMIVVAGRQGRLTVRQALVLALVFAAGAGALSLGFGAGYLLAGQFDPWLRGNILAPLSYAVGDDYSTPWRPVVFVALAPFLGLALGCAGLALPDAAARRPLRWVLPWLAASLLAALVPGKFYDHYFLILVPPLSLLAAFGLTAVLRQVVRPEMQAGALPVMVALTMAIPLAFMVLPMLGHGMGLRERDPTRQVAEIAAGALRPGEALFVANWHPIVYALAKAPPPTPYTLPVHLSGPQVDLAGVDTTAELHRVLALPPGVIVLSPAFWRLIRPEARALIEEAVARDYRLVATVNDGVAPVEVWRHR